MRCMNTSGKRRLTFVRIMTTLPLAVAWMGFLCFGAFFGAQEAGYALFGSPYL
jgi:hypothetical protein